MAYLSLFFGKFFAKQSLLANSCKSRLVGLLFSFQESGNRIPVSPININLKFQNSFVQIHRQLVLLGDIDRQQYLLDTLVSLCLQPQLKPPLIPPQT